MESANCFECRFAADCSGMEYPELYGCFSYCAATCQRVGSCDYTCPNNPDPYLNTVRWAEVGGVGNQGIESIRLSDTKSATLPRYVPRIGRFWKRGRSKGKPAPLETSWAAISLFDILRRSGKSEYKAIAETPIELRRHYSLRDDCKLLLVGVAEDRHLERFWRYHKAFDSSAALAKLGIEVVTPPNFSYFLDIPKTHYIWNRKRLLRASEELSKSGLVVSPHIYATNEFEWKFWVEFYREREHLSLATVEFQTADGTQSRMEDAVERLLWFRDQVGREIHPILVGGRHAAKIVSVGFDNFTITDQNPYMKSVNRMLFRPTENNGIGWRQLRTGESDGIRQHLNFNLRSYAEYIETNAAARTNDRSAKGREADRNETCEEQLRLGF